MIRELQSFSIVGCACLLAPLAAAQSGLVVAGSNLHGQLNVPTLPPGVRFTRVDAGPYHSVGLRSDGQWEAWGYNDYFECDIPALPPGLQYVSMKAGAYTTLALRSDGALVGWGASVNGNLAAPALPAGLSWVKFWASEWYSTALRSDGELVRFGDVFSVPLPALPPGTSWVDAAQQWYTLIALRSDGQAFATGFNYYGECDVPPLPPGVTYTQVATGDYVSGALRSDGQIVIWGQCSHGVCDVPPLPAGVTFTRFALAPDFAVALRSDGAVVAWGNNNFGQLDLAPAPPGHSIVEVDAGWSFSLARYVFDSAPTSTYCTAKLNSLGCVPAISHTGALALSGADDFVVRAAQLHNQRAGLLFWGRSAAAIPYMGGTLCVPSPVVRTPAQNSGGSATGDDCSGAFAFHFSNAYALSRGLQPGDDIYAQFWSRDDASAPYLASFTDALRARLAP